MSKSSSVPNYWPGYVDALTNVVLNLLFLVGLFTVGLVSLNMQLSGYQQLIVEIEADELLKAYRLKGSPSEEDIEHFNEKARHASSNSADKPVVQTDEIRLNDQTTLADGNWESGSQSELFRSHAVNLIQGQFTTQHVFPLQRFVWPSDRALSALPGSEHTYWLVNLTDMNNPRLLREAYERVTSLRDAYILRGVSPKSLQVRIAQWPSGGAKGLENTVYVIKRQP